MDKRLKVATVGYEGRVFFSQNTENEYKAQAPFTKALLTESNSEIDYAKLVENRPLRGGNWELEVQLQDL